MFYGHRWVDRDLYWQRERPDVPIPKQLGG
jgi:hypothetical protein